MAELASKEIQACVWQPEWEDVCQFTDYCGFARAFVDLELMASTSYANDFGLTTEQVNTVHEIMKLLEILNHRHKNCFEYEVRCFDPIWNQIVELAQTYMRASTAEEEYKIWLMSVDRALENQSRPNPFLDVNDDLYVIDRGLEDEAGRNLKEYLARNAEQQKT